MITRRDLDSDPLTAQRLVSALAEAGVERGDLILVHSSFKSLGSVDGGPATVVDALLAAVGETGTVIVPTFTATYETGPNSGFAYSPAETPSRVGVITEFFRQRPNAIRSNHPTHSLTAIGPKAERITADHWPGRTFDIRGPYGRYVADGAKIVFLGAPTTSNTTLHCVEEWLGLPYMADAVAVVRSDDGGRRTVHISGAPLGHRDFYSERGRIHSILETASIARTAMLNTTTIRVMLARSIVRATVEAELHFPGVLLCDAEDCAFCRKGRQEILKMRRTIEQNCEHLLRSRYAE